MPVIFSQLELLQDLSLRAEEPELANDLTVVFAKALERYCEAKRAILATAIENGDVEVRQTTRNHHAPPMGIVPALDAVSAHG